MNIYRLKTINNEYISENLELTSDVNKALTFKYKDKLNNFIQNMPRKFDGIEFNIEKHEIDASNKINSINKEKIVKKSAITKPKEIIELKYNIEKTLSIINKLKRNKSTYINLLSETDKNISTVYHYIELTENIPNDKCVEIIKVLKQLLKKRRDCKLIIQIIDNIENKDFKEIKQIIKIIDLLGNNLY